MYKIVITDTETGEIHINETSDCIIFAANAKDKVASMCLVNCSGQQLLITYATLKKVMQHIVDKHEIVGMLDKLGIIDEAIRQTLGENSDGKATFDEEDLVTRTIREAKAKYGKKD